MVSIKKNEKSELMDRHDSDSSDNIQSNSFNQEPGILVVDDEDSILELLGIVFENAGFKVWLAPDSQEAIDQYRISREEIGIVLLDVKMPYRDGPEILADLREINPFLIACFMTGCAGQYTDTELLGLGVKSIIRKPFQVFDLVRKITGIVNPSISATK